MRSRRPGLAAGSAFGVGPKPEIAPLLAARVGHDVRRSTPRCPLRVAGSCEPSPGGPDPPKAPRGESAGQWGVGHDDQQHNRDGGERPGLHRLAASPTAGPSRRTAAAQESDVAFTESMLGSV